MSRILAEPSWWIETDELILSIDHSWSTDFRVCLVGWAVGKNGPLERVALQIGDGTPVEITSWLPRPDVLANYPQYLDNDLCGFAVQANRLVEHRVKVYHKNDVVGELKVVGKLPNRYPSTGRRLWEEFVAEVNHRGLRVLEIGSRLVHQHAISKRQHFTQNVEYIGFDYYKDDNTDIVGDAHHLSKYFNGERFGAIFSWSVLEHLAMPWLAALEMAKVLEVGGVIFHDVPAAWPPHELPWDFWRISVEGLQALFSPVLGIKTEGVACETPVHMYFDDVIAGEEMYSVNPAYAAAEILARKAAEVDYSKFNWPATLADVLGAESAYPKR